MNLFTKTPSLENAAAPCRPSATINSKSTSTNNKPALFMRWVLMLMMFVSVGLNAQVVTVTNPGNTTPTLSATYGSLALAIADVNTRTAISGPVTITLNPGNPQTTPAGGYSITAIPTGASSTNKIVFEGSGNTITAFTPQTSGNLNDAIFKLIGADFITIQNFVMTENAANTTTTVASNNMTEFGVALFYASVTNGAQNNTIQNNTITLNKTNLNTFGIYSNTRASATAVTTTAEATSATGANSNNKFYGNTISNVNMGITLIGAAAVAVQDLGNDIGGTSAATGNTITNWGGAAAVSGYTSNSGVSYCIFVNHQDGDNVSYNTLTSATISGTAVTIRGIVKDYTTTSATGTFTTNITNNTITITDNFTSGTLQCIFNQGLTALSTATMNINNNTILNTSVGGTSSSTDIVGIRNASVPGVLNMNGNIIRGCTSTATSGGLVGIINAGAVVNSISISNNQIGNASGNAITFSAATSGAVTAISSTAGAAGATLTITNNDIRGIVHTVAGSSAHTYINWSHAAAGTDNINSNTFTNLNVNTTGSVTFLIRAGNIAATGIENVNTNSIVTGFNKPGAGGTVTLFAANASSVTGSQMNNTGNNFSSITLTGATTMAGWANTEGASSSSGPIKTITGNTFSNWTCGSGTVAVLSSNFGSNNTTVSTNTITGISGTNSIIGISLGSSNGGTTQTCASNTISTLSSTGGAINAIQEGASTVTTLNLNNNTIGAITVTGAFQINGIISSAGTTTNIFKNKIYNIQASDAAASVNGIAITAGTTTNIYNNLVGDLRTPTANAANPLAGLSLGAATTINVYYNTIYLNASSTGVLFGSSAVFASTTPTVNLRNNIFYNNSSVMGAGLAAAYRRSSTTLTTYASTSNNNDFFGSTIYTDGTNTDATLAAYKTRVSPRDAASISVVPNFLSTTGTSATFLHLNTGVATQLESGAVNITGFTDDYDNDIRQGNAGYLTQVNGGGTAPDIGADEFDGIPAPVCTNTPASSTITGVNAVCSGTGTTLSLSTTYTDLGITYQWAFSTTQGGPYTNLGTGATQATGNLTVTTYYVATITCTNSGLSFTTPEKTVTVNPLPTVAVNPTSATYCTPGGTAVTLNASGATTYSWAPAAGLSATTGSSVTASPSVTTTYTVTGTDANGCVNTATTTITVSLTPTNVTATATPATICSGFTSTLNGSATSSVPTTVSAYAFGTSTGASLDPMTGSTTVITANTTSGGTGDDTPSGLLSLPFTFNFNTTNYTQYTISPDGWIRLGSTVGTAEFTNSVTSTSNLPKIYPLWDDLATGADGNAKVLTTGTAPNRIFKIQWFVTNPRLLTGSANSTFQLWLYETTNVVEFRYGTVGTSSSASSGMTGSATNFQSITFTSNTASTATANDVNTTSPASGRLYSFTPSNLSLTYAWAPAGDVVSPNAQSTATNALTATETFTLTVTNGGCSATATATVTVSGGAAISTQPANTNICAGATGTLSVIATGPGLTYQWRKGGTPLSNGGNISGATSATLSIANAAAADAGSYDVVVSATCGSPVTSTSATVTVTTPVAGISVSPSATICAGQSVTLTENGGNATSWSWSPGGQTTQSITVSPANTTTYTVTASLNGCSATASQTITVNPSPTAVTITPSAPSICSGASVNLVASGGLIPTAGTVTLGTGTSSTTASTTASTLGPNPLESYYGGAKQQMIVLASELTAAGIVAGPISSIAFNLSAVESRTLLNFQVKMQNTALAAFSSTTFVSSGFTVVRTAASYTPVTGWNTIAFNTNFNWNGTSNILIETNFSNNDGGGTGTNTALYSTTAFASTLFYRVDSNTPAAVDAATTASFSAYTQRNNLQFGATVLGPGTYNWLPNDGSLNTNTGANVTASPTSTTTYTATVTLGSCSSSGTSTVTVNPNYTITASAGANGSISPNGVTTVTCNGTGGQTYTITPNTCYSVANVLVDGVSVGAVTTYTFSNVTANHTISATFVQTTYTITATSGANGTVTPAGASTVNCGANATYTITPAACYAIADVLVDGTSVGAVGTYTFTNVTANHTISATFVQTTYTITATSGANGSVTPAGASTVNCGANATYTITPAACYAIADVLVDGTSVGAVGTYTFTNVTANHTISATFVQTTYTITATSGANGTVTPAGVSTVNCGANATYTITADPCYHVLNVFVDGAEQGPITTYTFINVTGNHTISATFAINTYTLTATSGANGSVTPAGASTVNCGDNATYTITPAACYAIADVLVDGTSVGAVGTYTFTNVTANHTISATFVQTTYTITATSGANGMVTPAGASTVNCGDNATYTITPAACYAIADVLVDGTSVGAVGTYTFTNVTANHTISATFVQTTYTITATSGANGSVTPAGASTVNCGDNATYTITADVCYHVLNVFVDGAEQGPITTYTFTNVTGNHTISATFAINTYTITATSGANGTVTPDGASTVNCGDNATYTITPAACYAIADVLVDGTSVGAVGTYTFTNVTANHTISATFVQTTYTITATSGANGSVTPAGASTVNCGDNATYTITPAACYAIADVLVDGTSVGAVGTYTFTNVTANHTISATFVQTTYTITATNGANGTVTPAGASTVNCGDNATYTITPAACYAIADVLVDGTSVGAVGTYTFTNVTANHTISATFVQTTYTITATSGANGSVTPAGASTVNCGDNATYTITPAACYAIADVLVDGTSVGAVGTYTFTNVTANHTISATFVQTTYTITATSGANGSVTPAGASTVNCGDNATYTITPAACYAIADVLVDGTSVGAVGTYTFTNVTANHTISATFVQTTYTITATSGANGTVTPAGASTVNCGDNATYTITPAACYAIADVLVDGTSVGAVGTYTFTNVTANHTISATFVQTTYTITATSGANGTVTPAGASTVNCGDNATYTITPAACYAIADVLVDGTSVGAVGTYTFTNVTANHTISATFVQTTYTITATSGANGTVTPAGASTVNCGDNATYTITPAACYAIADVLVDGTSVGAVGTYTFTNVTANHTISATFVQTTYTITATSGANGIVTPAGASAVNCGDNATYTINPAACYAIADVLVDGTSVGAVGTYTFTNVTANHTISATFVQTTYTITATSGANGSVTPAGASTVNCGDNATYTITPAACYAIADVLVDGTSVGAVGTYTFTNVTANHTISATFVQTTYTITATSGANGSVTPAGASTVNCGDNATYTITPAACYAIADVLVDGTSVGAVGTYTFTNVTANHTISATFVQTTYTITATSGANGSVTPAGASTVNCGDNATYTITPAACYAIADVLVDGTSVGAVGTYTFTNVTANHTISASFVQTTYTITATSGANGSVTPAGASPVNCGANATYTITPAACYAIADVLVDGTSVGAVGTYTFTNVTANHTISATFVQTTYTITATSGANGTVTPAGASTVNCGANATYTITPNAGYAISNVIVDGASVGAVGTYTFTNVTANHTISATFVATGGGFTITSGAGANGTISPNGVTSVPSGGSQSYTMTPAACYHVQNVLVDGTSVGAVSSYTFTNVTANHTISVSFAINAPLTVSVSGPVNVCPYVGTGEQVTYTATSAGATGFTWVTPPNVNIVSGQGTANLVVTFGAGFTAAQPNKQLKVTALSPCGNSTQFIYYLAVQTPTTPQPIVAGSSDVCAVIGTAGTITYTIPSVSGASSYNWSAQAGTTTITHPNGLGVNDTTVNVSFTNGFSSSNITVSATSPCATSGTRSLLINRNSPSTPGLISGPTNACEYIAPNGTPATYSVNAVATATSYTWTYPAGAIGVTGQGTNSISFTYPAGFTSGTVTVTATNGCGTSGVRSLTITKLNPATPSVIDVIQTSPCPNRVYTYTLSAMPSNATSVLWTVPAGGTIISGQGTTSITVSYAATAIQGNVTAQGVSNCGTSATRISAVKLAACAAGGRPVFTKTTAEPQLLTVAGMDVSVFPNPTTTDFKLQIITAGKEAINVRILDLQGRSLKAMTVQPHTTVNIGSDLKAGAYMIEVRQGQEIKTTRVLKF